MTARKTAEEWAMLVTMKDPRSNCAWIDRGEVSQLFQQAMKQSAEEMRLKCADIAARYHNHHQDQAGISSAIITRILAIRLEREENNSGNNA